MRSIKMFGLAALAALMAMAFVGVSSVTAESTALCSNDLEGLSVGKKACTEVTHVHETSVGKAKLLSEPTMECDVLFLGDTVAGTSAPLHINGTFTYTNCNNSCVVTEENGPALIEVLKTAEELSSVTGERLVKLNCFFGFIKCIYNGEGLAGHGTGPLKSAQTNGSVVITEQETHIESGGCPESTFLDITTTPLSATYIGGKLLSYCVEYEHKAGGLYQDSECKTGGAGAFELVWGRPGLTVGQVGCVIDHDGLWKKVGTSNCAEDIKTLTGGGQEKATIRKVE